MSWIENVAAADIPRGFHSDPGPNSMLIQIMDTGTPWWPEPQHRFKETYRFEFLDIEENDEVFDEECRFSQTQADQLVQLLCRAKELNQNIICHCFAGVSRSGAVVEMAVEMGFDDPLTYREPNQLVLLLMRRSSAFPK